MSGIGSVLVVDDSRFDRVLTANIAESFGYEVHQASSGEMALEMASGNSYDCILLDLDMPEMDGFEVLLQLKQEPRTMHIPVLVMANIRHMESEVMSIEMGAIDFLTKPVNTTLLGTRLRTSLAEKRIRDLEKDHFLEMKRLKARLSAVIDESPMGIILFGLDGLVQEVNPSFVRMMGASEPCDLNRAIAEMCEDDDGLLQNITDFYERGGSGMFSREIVMRKLDDSTFNAGITISLVRSEDGSPPFTMAMVEDITIRKVAEAALRQNEESLRMIFDSAPYPLFLTTVDGIILDINTQAEIVFEKTREEAKGLRAIDFYVRHVDRMEILERMRTKGYVDGYEVEMRTSSGKARWGLMSMRYVTLAGRKCLITALYDITERREMQRSLEEANRKLSLLNSITRHDIVNQTVVLSGYIDMVKRRSDGNDVGRSLDKMRLATENINKQITFTKDYQDMGNQGSGWYDVGKVFDEAFGMLRPCGVETQNEGYGYEIMADHLVQKVFYNLIDNSIRHGERVKKMRLSCHLEDDHLAVCFEDNGCGVREEDKPRLFEKGFGKNTGLGLFLTREILSMTSITIVENGQSGNGARFEMRVPFENVRTM